MQGASSIEEDTMKTLIICIDYPLPESTGGNIRTMNFVRFFKKYGSVDVAYHAMLRDAKPGNGMFSNEYLLEKKSYPARLAGRLSEICRGRPYPIRAYSDRSEKLLLSIIKSNDYDYVLVRYIDQAYCLFGLPMEQRKRVILDFDDIKSGVLYESFFKKTKRLHKRMMINLNRKFLQRYERKCLKFGVSLFCSEEDGMRTAGNRKDKVIVPNIYLNKTFEGHDFKDGFGNGYTLLFVGTLTYAPNIEGLKWFIESVYPDQKRKYPDTKLLVVGLNPGDEVRKLCRGVNNVELHADVPDVKEYYERCKAVVVPLLSGGGTRIKILEAALAGRPVLSTPVGAEGLDLNDGRHLLLFNNAEEFVLKYKEMLDENKYHSMVSSARQFVLRNYSADKFNEAMERALNMMGRKLSQ